MRSIILAVVACLIAAPRAQETFSARVASMSEPGGYFNTDNLISNERSYLHVIPALRVLSAQAGRDGVYLGVGPDQNFSYIAHLRPSLAILIDIRRDNLLLHLLFKALFAEARTRVEYLALLTGRAPPDPLTGWSQKPLDAIISVVDAAKVMPADRLAAFEARLAAVIKGFGVPLAPADLDTIRRFHRRFIDEGLSLQFNTTGRAPQYDYPTYRDLLLEVDRQNVRQSFVATEESFQFVKSLQAQHLIIPIVGDLSGARAMAAVAKFLASRRKQISAFYTSNVEFYLFRDGSFPRFMANLARLPHQPGSVIIRSIFPSGGAAPPPGYNSTSLTQPIQTLLDGYAKGQFRDYRQLAKGSGLFSTP